MITLEWPDDLTEVLVYGMPYTYLVKLKALFDAGEIYLTMSNFATGTDGYSTWVFTHDYCKFTIVTVRGTRMVERNIMHENEIVDRVSILSSKVCKVSLIEWNV